MKFTKKTYEYLQDAGWNENRRISTKQAENMLLDRGYEIIDIFVDFYTQFGDLVLLICVDGVDRTIDFDLNSSFGIDYDELIIDVYPKAIGCNFLNIIGNANGNSLLVIDEKKYIYILDDGTAKIIGNNTVDAINNLCNKGWRWFDQFELPWKERWNGLKFDFEYVRVKQIENHKNYINKYKRDI